MTNVPQPEAQDSTDVNAVQISATAWERTVSGPVRHKTFIELRHLDADPVAVFSALANPIILRRWFKLPGTGASYEQDFRVGGGDRARSIFRHLDGTEERLKYRNRYLNLVPGLHIVYGCESLVDEVLC